MSAREQGFAGMTVNECLVTAGLLDEFDAAIDSDDRRRAIQLLERVAMSRDSATSTVDTVVADPAKYGYPRSS